MNAHRDAMFLPLSFLISPSTFTDIPFDMEMFKDASAVLSLVVAM